MERSREALDSPVARVVRNGAERLVTLGEVARVLASDDLVVDACRRTVTCAGTVVSLVTRPVLLALAATLANASPESASRATLAEVAFGARRITESTRARLRVEMGRLRRALQAMATIEATAFGYRLRPRGAHEVVAIHPPAPGEASEVLALLRDGGAWSTSALASAMGTGQRTVQRALISLRDEGRVDGVGRGRAQRWVAKPPEGIPTSLLLLVRGSDG